jgi:hypothetical protein
VQVSREPSIARAGKSMALRSPGMGNTERLYRVGCISVLSCVHIRGFHSGKDSYYGGLGYVTA